VTAAPGPATVLGAGAIGCFVGGRLQAAGADMDFVGRPRVLDAMQIEAPGLMQVAGTQPAQTTPLPPHRRVQLLRWPS
jgi:ketopantoate reductase